MTHFSSMILMTMVLSEIEVMKKMWATVVRLVSTYPALQYSDVKSQVSIKIIGSSSTWAHLLHVTKTSVNIERLRI